MRDKDRDNQIRLNKAKEWASKYYDIARYRAKLRKDGLLIGQAGQDPLLTKMLAKAADKDGRVPDPYEIKKRWEKIRKTDVAEETLEEEKPKKIKNTSDYSYKGYTLGKYESARGGTRWMVIKDNKELKADFTSIKNAQNYIDSHLKEELLDEEKPLGKVVWSQGEDKRIVIASMPEADGGKVLQPQVKIAKKGGGEKVWVGKGEPYPFHLKQKAIAKAKALSVSGSWYEETEINEMSETEKKRYGLEVINTDTNTKVMSGTYQDVISKLRMPAEKVSAAVKMVWDGNRYRTKWRGKNIEIKLVEKGMKESINEGTDEVRELEIFIDNDAQLYKQRVVPIQKNYTRKWKKEQYDHEKAVKGFIVVAREGAKKYEKEFGSAGSKIFSASDIKAVARSLADNWKAELEAGNMMEETDLSELKSMKPKKPFKRRGYGVRSFLWNKQAKRYSKAEALDYFRYNDKTWNNKRLTWNSEGLDDPKSVGDSAWWMDGYTGELLRAKEPSPPAGVYVYKKDFDAPGDRGGREMDENGKIRHNMREGWGPDVEILNKQGHVIAKGDAHKVLRNLTNNGQRVGATLISGIISTLKGGKELTNYKYGVNDVTVRLAEELSPEVHKEKERIADKMDDEEFKKRYGKDWKGVKIATATNVAKKKVNEGNFWDQFGKGTKSIHRGAKKLSSTVAQSTPDKIIPFHRQDGTKSVFGWTDSKGNDHVTKIVNGKVTKADIDKELKYVRKYNARESFIYKGETYDLESLHMAFMENFNEKF